MKVSVKVIPRSSKQRVIKEGKIYKVYLNSSPEKNRANKELVEYISKSLNISKSSITIIKGLKSRKKVLNIDGIDEMEFVNWDLT